MNKVYKSKETEQKVIDARVICASLARQRRVNNIAIYLESPKKCLNCENIIEYDKRKNKFCSRSCSATFTNPVSKRKELPCCPCVKRLEWKSRKYCSRECFLDYHKQLSLEKHNLKFISGEMNDNEARRFFRKITFHQCSICLLEEWNGQKIPLEVDHIDGNTNNNFPSNLRFVCRNCGAQLPTAGSKNKRSGRTDKRAKWYFELKKSEL